MKPDFPNNLKAYGRYSIYIVFGIICVVLALSTSRFFTISNLTLILTQASINGLLAFGVTLVIIGGGIDLSLGSILAVAGVSMAVLAQNDKTSLPVAILAGLAAGVLFGGINGFFVTKFRVPPFIVTLGTMTIGRGLALIISNGRPVSSLPEALDFLGNGNLMGIPMPVIVLAIAYIVCSLLLTKTTLGRYIYAVGGNENAAEASGIRVQRVKMWIYTLCGLLAAIGGIVLTARISTGQPNAGAGFELNAIAAAIIGGASTTGGKGSMTGTLIGALLIGVIGNSLDLLNVSSYYQQVAMGLIIIGAAVLDRLGKTD